MDTVNKLWRSRDGYIGGVCAGIAERHDCDPIVIRILAVLIALSTLGIGCIAYAIMWISLPLAPVKSVPYDVEPESVQSSTYGSVECSQARGRTVEDPDDCYHDEGVNTPVRIVMALALLLLFYVVSNAVCPFVKGTYWWQYWPCVLIMAGLALMVVPIARELSIFWHIAGAALAVFGSTIIPISLGFYSPLTLAAATSALWPVLTLSAVLFAFGVHKRLSPVALLALLLFLAFCIVTVTSFGIPGYMDDFVIMAPDGNRLYLHGPGL